MMQRKRKDINAQIWKFLNGDKLFMCGNLFSGRHKRGKYINATGITSPTAQEMLKSFEEQGGIVIRPQKEIDPYKDFPFYKNLSEKNKKR